MSNHLTEDQLVLHYYGEYREAGVDAHLDGCEECRGQYRSLQRVLNVVDTYPVPERGPEYGVELWDRLRGRLPRSARPSRVWDWFSGSRQWAAAGAMALVLIGTFYAGRLSVKPRAREVAAYVDAGFDQRVLLSAVGNHLDRSQVILVELANGSDIQSQRADVQDLLDANRLFRTSAAQAGEGAVADVLDELERLLVEVAHLAPMLTPEAALELRQRIMNEGILFKVKVTESEVREREKTTL